MKEYKFLIAYLIVFAVPPLVYFLGNLYWWLFDGNVLNNDKMLFAGFFTFCVLVVAPLVYLIDEEMKS